MIKLDLRNKKKLKSFIKKINPSTVIHLAGMRDPSLNEKKPKESRELNLEVTKNLVNNLNKKTHFIFFQQIKLMKVKKVFIMNCLNHHQKVYMENIS